MNGVQQSVPVEIVAAITAALAAVLDQPVGSFIVKRVEPVYGGPQPQPSVWAKAGVLESHFARRQFGLRVR